MTKKSLLLLSLLIVTAVLATPDLPNLNINHEDCNCNNVHTLHMAALSDQSRLQKLSDEVLPHAGHYAGRIKELIQLSCSPSKGSILLQVPSKSSSNSQKARILHSDLQELNFGDSSEVNFVQSNLKEASLSLVQLHEGTVERNDACHSAQEKVDLHSSFIQKVEEGHKEVEKRLNHIDNMLKQCTIAIQIPKNDNVVQRDNDAISADGTLSNELKKRLGLLTDRNDDNGEVETKLVAPQDFYSHSNLDDLQNAYKSQIAKAANVKLSLGNLGNQIAQLQQGANNANNDGEKQDYQNKLVLHQRIQKLLGDQYACEIAKAILIQICIKIKIDITVVIDILITYHNNAQNLAPGSEAYLQNLGQQYPYELQFAGLLRRNLAAEKRYQLENNKGANLINQLVPVYNQLQNVGFNTAPELTSCQNQLASLQGSNNYLKGYIPQLNLQYQNQIGKLVPYYLTLNKAGMTPGQNLQNQISTYLIQAPTFAPHQLYPTAKALNKRLGQQMNLVNQYGTFLTNAGVPIPGQYLTTTPQYQLTPEIQALQNQYNAEALVVPTLNQLVPIQQRLEFLFGQLQNVGKPGFQLKGLANAEGGEAAAPQSSTPEEQAYNIQLSICGLLQIKLELLCQHLCNLQNSLNNLNQGMPALQSSPTPNYKLAFQFGQNYAPQLTSETQNVPGEISTCQNMLTNMMGQLRKSPLARNVPEALIWNRLGNVNNLIGNLENQVARGRKPLVMQHIGQEAQYLQQGGQPVEFNLIPALNELEAPQAAHQQLIENQIQGLVEARAPHANLYQNYLQSQCGQAAQLRPTLENYILQAARLNRMLPGASPSRLAELQPQIGWYNLMGNNMQNEFNLAKQIGLSYHVINNLEGQIYNLIGQGQPGVSPSNLESVAAPEAGTQVGYPQQLQLCVLLKLRLQFQIQLLSALSQAPGAQLQKIYALQKVPSYLTQEAQLAPAAIIQGQNLAKNYRLEFANQFPVANIWANRYQNALARLNSLAPSGVNVPAQIMQLVPQNMAPQQGENYIVNNIVGLIPNQYSTSQLYPQHLKHLILVKFALENQLQQAANLQNQLNLGHLAPQQRHNLQQQLTSCQNQAQALQAQYQPHRNLVNNLKYYTLCNNQISNLRNQVQALQAPYANNLNSIPEAVNQQIYPLQLQLCALIKIQLQVCIQLATACQNINNTYPSSSLIPSNLAPWLSEGQLPSPQLEYQNFVNLIAANKILFGEQQAPTANLGVQLKKIQSPSQLRGQYMPYYNTLKPQLGNEAETQCGNELQNMLVGMIPSNLQPLSLLPQHLSLCMQVKLQLENCVQQAAQLQNQIQMGHNLTPQQRQNLVGQLNHLQNQAVPLQQQYANQYEICVLLKFLTLCQSQLQNLNNQVNHLMSQYPNASPNYLENAEGTSIPPSVKQQLCQLQIQILACIRLCFQVCVPLAQAVSQCNNEVPSSNLLPFNLVNQLTPVQLPTAGQEYPVILQFIILIKFQMSPQETLCNNLASSLPQALSPSQVETQCNNYLKNLGPQLRGQAETGCNNELQNMLVQNIPSSLTPSELYPQHLQLVIQLRQQIENLIPQAAHLKKRLAGHLAPQEAQQLQNELTSCQNQIGQLQGQLGPQNAILVTLKFIILLEGQIQNLNNQIAPLMSQFTPSQLESGSIPQNVQNQICQIQIQILACCKLMYQLCSQFANEASQCNNTAPQQLVPFYLQGVPRNSLLPTPGQAQQIGLQYIVLNKLRHNLQQSLCNSLGAQLPQALSPSQVQTQCNNYLNNLSPQLANQAETSCANEIQQNLAGEVPTQLVPEESYPLHLSLCLQNRLQLENALQNAANLQNQLGRKNLTPQQIHNLQQELVPWQNLANQLQPQYNSQKEICVLLKFLILIEGQISACNNQMSSLVPGFSPSSPSSLIGQSIPTELQPQVYQLQVQLLAATKLKHQIASKLSYALQHANNTYPQQRLEFPFLQSGRQLPTAQLEYLASVPLVTICQSQLQQQQNLVNNLAGLLPQRYSPSEVETQCNNYLNNLRPNLANLAETQCNNEMQNNLAQNIPSSMAPEQLYPLHLSLCSQVKQALEHALQNAANVQYQLQQPNLKPELQKTLKNRLGYWQGLANNLQPQYQGQKEICVMLKFCIIIEGQIQNLNNQISSLMAPYSNLGPNQGPTFTNFMAPQSSIPANIKNQCCQLQIQLLACIKIKFQICIQVCQAISTCNNTPPGQATTTETTVPSGQTPSGTSTESGVPTPTTQTETTVPTGGSTSIPIPQGETVTGTESGQAPSPGGTSSQPVPTAVPTTETVQPTTVPTTLPTPGQEHKCCIILCVCIKLKFELQQSLCNNLGSELPQALTPTQINNLVQNQISAIQPGLANQAETECNNELQNNLASRIPVSLTPEQLYPQHLSLCNQLQTALQYMIQQAAPLQNQLQQSNLAPTERQRLVSLLTPIQNHISTLQPQYNNQKEICVLLKFLIIIEGQISSCNNQIANLVPSGNFANIPQNLQNQIFPLQVQLLALMNLKHSVCGQLAPALTSCNNSSPASLIPSEFIPSKLSYILPSPSQELTACNNYGTVAALKLEQQQQLVNNLGALMPQAWTPAQIRPQVNQYLVGLRPRLANQAETQCANEEQNNLAQFIPTSLMPQSLYPQMLSACLQNKLALEHALQRAANLQNRIKNANLSPEELQPIQQELTACQNQANQLQPQYASCKQICILLKFCIILEGQINNLNNQIAHLMAPYSSPNSLEAIPQNVQNQVYPLQVQLLVCIKIKFQVCGQLYSECNNYNGQAPSNIMPNFASMIPANLQVSQFPQPSQLIPAYLQFLVINKVKHNLQRSLVYSLAGQMPTALTPSQVETQCNNSINNLRPGLLAQAETQCANELQNKLAQNIPANMSPEALYPLHLSLCANVLNNLQHALVRGANLANMLQQPGWTPEQLQSLQNELTSCQNQAAQLQQQYENQKEICIALKFITLCEGQINNLNNQIAHLMNQYRPKGLQGPSNVFNLENLPQNVQQQCCHLQLQLLACIKIKFQICIQLCQFVSSCNNTTPSGPGSIPTGGATESVPTEYVPTASGNAPSGTESSPTSIPVTESGGQPAGQAAPTVSETASIPTVEHGTPSESGFPTTEYGGPGSNSGSVPGVGSVPGSGPVGGSLPTPGNEHNCCIQICIICKIKFELQLSLCNNLAQQYPQALAPSQIQPQLNQLIGQIRPRLEGQAQTSCANNLQNYFQNRIPRTLVPTQVYPTALRKAAALRFQLENALNNLANAASPLYSANQPGSYIVSQLAPQLSQCQGLQQQYENQKNVCISIKFILLIQGELPGLVNQVNHLIGQGPKYRLQPYNIQSIAPNLVSQVSNLQNQIVPRIRLQYQTFNNLAQTLAPYNINNLQPSSLSPEFSTCVIYICILSLQQQNQLGLAQALQPKLTPEQLETQCNNSAENLRPTYFNQAQNLVTPAIQQLVPSSSQGANSLRPLQLRLALQLGLINNVQNQLNQAQNNANSLVGAPGHNYMLTYVNELQNRLAAENQIGKMLYYLIPIQQNMNQYGSQLVPGQPNALINNLAPTQGNLANQAKLAFLFNLQHLVNVKLANEQQNSIQALTNCVNALGNMMNNAPNRLARNVYALQRQTAMNALTQCQNQYQNMANVQIPQTQSALQQQQSLCNNLETACQNAGVSNPSALVSQAQQECKAALAIIIDVTAIIETDVHTVTNVKTQGEPGNGEATVQTNVHNNVGTSTQTVGGSSFLSMRKL